MARNTPAPVQQYRGTTNQHANYVGGEGELTVDTTKDVVVVHDGNTKGGFPMAKDSTVVHLTGNENIAGTKTFTGIVRAVTPGATPNARDVVTVEYLPTFLQNALADGAVSPGDGINVDVSGTQAVVSVDETWLEQQVDTIVAETVNAGNLVDAGNGVTVTNKSGLVTVAAKAGTGVTVNTTGINVNTTWLGQQIVSAVRTDTDLIVGGNGLSETVGTNGKTLSVGAGTGISVAANTVGINTTWLDDRISTIADTDEMTAFRKRMIGVPVPWRSTTLPENHCWANGDLILFADWPELEEIYNAGGFAGMLLAYNADSSTIAANLGKWRPNAANPTGLYAPNLSGQFLQASVGTGGTTNTAGLPNITGSTHWTRGGGFDGMVGEGPIMTTSGVFAGSRFKGNTQTGSKGDTAAGDPVINFNAAYSNTIYGASTTVMPASVQIPFIIYLGLSA